MHGDLHGDLHGLLHGGEHGLLHGDIGGLLQRLPHGDPHGVILKHGLGQVIGLQGRAGTTQGSAHGKEHTVPHDLHEVQNGSVQL